MGEKQEVAASLVQIVAESSDSRPPPRFILREEDRPNGDAPVASDIPVIDISRLFRSDDGNDEAEKLRSALQSWGLFQVTILAGCLICLLI